MSSYIRKSGIIVVILGVFSLASLSSHGDETKRFGNCQTQEVVTVCPAIQNFRAVYQVMYSGYLLGKGHAITAEGTLNGTNFNVAVNQRQFDGAGPWLGILYLPYTPGHLRIYFHNDMGEYHSKNGDDFHFDF